MTISFAHWIRVTCVVLMMPLLASAQSAADLYHPAELYLKLDDSFPKPISDTPSESVTAFIQSLVGEASFKSARAGFFRSKSDLAQVYHVYLQHDDSLNTILQKLSKADHVVYAERIPISRKFDIPNDLGSNTTGANGQYYLYKIQASAAWDIQVGDPSIRVAVIDDAVDVNHSELSGLTMNAFNAVDNSSNVSPNDANWDHGTFISGLITAKTNNGAGMASLGRGLRIIPVKVTDANNSSILINEYEAITYAYSIGANVINMSWGAEVASQTGLITITEAHASGAVLVAAAGNSNDNIVKYPAAFPNVISVAATTSIDSKSTFSSYGSWIDISAPGQEIWSLAPNGDYTVKSGTSFSAPLISAAAGLMLSNNPSLTADEILSCLQSSADNIDLFNPNFLGQLGAGRLNMKSAMECVAGSSSGLDVWLAEVISPQASACATTFPHQIRLLNQGLDTVFTMKIRYQLDNGFPQVSNWNDTFPPQTALLIDLPELSAAIGNHILRVTVLDTLNGNQVDSYPADNDLVFNFSIEHPVGQSLPFIETFESGSFNTQNWFVNNPGSDFGWEIAPSSGLSVGSKSARLPYFVDFEVGSRDFLLTPTLNFSAYQTVSLSFDYAYMQRTPGLSDSLAISVSNDCGETWLRVWARGEDDFGSFATRPYGGTFFTPQLPADWCGQSGFASCGLIDLSAFAGETGVRVRFEGVNSNGNNIYLDNINITGQQLNLPPVANFNADGNLQVCVNENVILANTSINQPTDYKWYLPGTSIDSSAAYQPSIAYSAAGTYSITLIATNAQGSDTLTLTDYITVVGLPDVSILMEPDSICRGQSATLTAQGADQYLWSSSFGLPATTQPSVTVNPQVTTSYSVTGYSNLGCIAQASSALTVVLSPVGPAISVIADTAIICSDIASSYQWYVNGLIIDGATDQSFVPLMNGNYNVRVYNAFGCSAISAPFQVIFVGIAEGPYLTSFEVYPNPSKGFIHLEFPSPQGSLELIDASGRLLLSKEIIDTKSSLDLSNLAPGMYLVRYIDGVRHAQRTIVLTN